MMNIGNVRMAVHEPFVPVRVRMRLLAIPFDIVRVLMMLVVAMAMVVRHCFM